MTVYRRHLKRLFDLFLIFMFFPVIVFFFLFACLGLFFFSKDVFFTQKRQGINGSSFDLFKFNTMSEYMPDHHNSVHDLRRVTPFGAFLRKTSIDEIPQFLNVLKGEMSIVGPRPLPTKYFNLYSSDHKKRLDVLPGITGLAQVNGRNSLSWKKRFDYDIIYIKQMSFKQDLLILFRSLSVIVRSSGINVNLEDTMTEFNGYK